MLDDSLKIQLREHFQKITKHVHIEFYQGEHPSRDELKTFLEEIEELSDWIQIIHSDEIKSGIEFSLLQEGLPTGIHFLGIPGGHEFTSFVLAILQTGGVPPKLDEYTTNWVKGIQQELKFETFVSLDCHNCPEIVQALNSFSILNPNISNTMIDGALAQEEITSRGIQGVPTVYLNGERFSSGKMDISGIIDKLTKLGIETQEFKPTHNDNTMYDVAIIGGGPSGVTSAVYSARKGLKVIVIADRIGGQLQDTLGIENLISLPYTTGPELSSNLKSQLHNNQVVIRENVRVEQIKNSKSKEIVLNTGEIIQSKTIIISTGAKWRELNVPGEKENIGRGVAYCPHCDGPFFKGKKVAVVGGGNSGVEAALDLAGIVDSVTVLEFGNKMNADQVLLSKLHSTSNIRTITNAETTEIRSTEGKVTGLIYKNRETNTSEIVNIDGVFVQIGLIPNSHFLKGLVELNRMGEILVDDKCRTSVEGIFACGDVTQTPYKQIIIAMGEGAKAAISAFDYIMRNSE
jgi:alkyl hydroperoxide reductase subunit F